MTNEQNKFINTLMPIIKKYAGFNYSVECIMAQAIIESAWGKSLLATKHYNFFGMKCGSGYKGDSVTLSTKEEINGKTITIKGNFRSYPDLESGIAGYFNFINSKRYTNLKGVTNYKEYACKIKEDGWATSSTYPQNLIKVVETYLLKNDAPVVATNYGSDAIETIARYVIKGYYGNGNNTRSNNIYNDVQYIVNCIISKKTVETDNDLKKALYVVACDVIKGTYGNGATNRRANIYNKVRSAVNKIMKG